jgi:hypothetical protein
VVVEKELEVDGELDEDEDEELDEELGVVDVLDGMGVLEVRVLLVVLWPACVAITRMLPARITTTATAARAAFLLFIRSSVRKT